MELKRQDLRKFIYYGWMRDLNAPAIANEMCQTLGDNIITSRTCQSWISKFNEGNFDTLDEERDGRPSIEGVDVIIEECLIEDPRATCSEIASYTECSIATVWRHMKALGKKYLANKWVPHKLSEENKANRLRISGENLQKLHSNHFLNQLITVDEIWIFWDNEGCKPGSHNRSWRGSGDDAPLVCKQTSMTTRKHLAIIFWDAKGILLYKTLPKNTSITAAVYCEALDELKLALQEKRRRIAEFGLNNFHFLHDNARPHTALVTQEKLASLGLIVLPHPPYSPDLSPSDYYLFSPLKAGFKGRNYATKEDIDIAIQTWVDEKPVDFFSKRYPFAPKQVATVY
jgi:[histone H3]-lysine36 N-dimethyltransferase SETMAR